MTKSLLPEPFWFGEQDKGKEKNPFQSSKIGRTETRTNKGKTITGRERTGEANVVMHLDCKKTQKTSLGIQGKDLKSH